MATKDPNSFVLLKDLLETVNKAVDRRVLQIQTAAVSGTFALPVTTTDLILTKNLLSTVAPEIHLNALNGGWVVGIDVANAPGARDLVLAGKKDFPNPGDVNDLVYIAHRGSSNPTIGLGQTPPDGTYRVQIAAADNEVTMGGLGIRRGPSQTAHVFAVYDSNPTDRLWIDKDFYVKGANSAVGCSLAVKANDADGRSVAMTKADGTVAYGFLHSGNDCILRYITGGANEIEFKTTGIPNFPNGLSFASAAKTLVDVTSPVTALRLKHGGDTAFVVENNDAAGQTMLGASASGGYVGTFTNNTFSLRTNNTSRWQINNSGHLLPVADNTYDLGITSTNRIRTGYFQTSVVLGTLTQTDASGFFSTTGGFRAESSSSGFRTSDQSVILINSGGLLLDNAVSNILQFQTLDKSREILLGGRVQTTDATTATAVSRTIADNTSESLIIHVSTKRTSSSEAAAYQIHASVHRAGGGAVLNGQTPVSTIESAGAAANTCVVDVSGNDLRVRVTGQAGQTWEWHAVINTMNSNA